MVDILDQMEAWRENARLRSEQDFFSRMMLEIRNNRKEIERLRDALRKINDDKNWDDDGCWIGESYPDEIAAAALKESE